MMYELYETYGHRYDLHTPPGHYQHDHQLVIDLARERGLPCRLLDVGCGSGVLVGKARAAGIDAFGIDASATMVAAARQRASADVVRVQRMQDLDERSRYNLVVSLSWSIHYCAGPTELADVLRRIRAALVPGGGLLLQVAHGPHLAEGWREDLETGPSGLPGDVVLRYRFRPESGARRLSADYAYRCESLREELEETHVLEMTDALAVARLVEQAGFDSVTVWDSWRRDAFDRSGNVLVWGLT